MGKYFTIAEMVKSETADRRGIDNRLPKALICNVDGLIDNVLDPLREAYGKPVIVTSGYRCEALNKAVGGSKTSEHMKGMAADIVGTPNTKAENKKLFNLVQELNLPFTQLIDEKNFSWVHVSYDSCNVKKQVLKLYSIGGTIMATINLEFKKNSSVWYAEFQVNSDFNIHLERDNYGRVNILQRTTSEGNFEPVVLPGNLAYNAGTTIDCDFSALVYPKTIRVESYSEVLSGTVTESGNEA